MCESFQRLQLVIAAGSRDPVAPYDMATYDPERATLGSLAESKEKFPYWSTRKNRQSHWQDARSLSLRNRRRAITTLSWLTGVYILYVIVSSVLFPGTHHNDVLRYVDPLIGTGGKGHVFAGATLPFGMAKPVADVGGNDNMAGFAWGNNKVDGFSSLHDSGSGGLASMGNFPIFLLPTCPDLATCTMTKSKRAQAFDALSVHATPGYFTLTLTSGVRAEMTASSRTSLFRFSFNP